MTDLERARVPSDNAMVFVRERHMKECRDGTCYTQGHGFCLCKGIALMLDDFAAAARQQGAAEMRERAAQTADGASELMADSDIQFGSISGVAADLAKDLADAIRALPLTKDSTPDPPPEAKARPK